MEMSVSTHSSQTNLVMDAWTQSIAQVCKEISTKPTTPSPHAKKALECLEKSTILGIKETIRAKRRPLQCSWLALLILANGTCLVHLYFLLEAFTAQPNGVSMQISMKSELVLPHIHICQPWNNMLDFSLLGDVTYEQFFALELGVGLVRKVNFIWEVIPILNMTAVEEYMSLVGEDPASAYRQFFNEKGLQCGDLFDKCVDSNDEEFDCCQVFERVFTLRGVCWVSKKDSLKIKDSVAGSKIRFSLNNVVYSSTIVSIADYLDQGADIPESVPKPSGARAPSVLSKQEKKSEKRKLLPYDFTAIKLKYRHRTFSGQCVVDENLDYFIDYSVSNCQLERNLLKQLHQLLNDTCELPLVELLKPGYKSENLCNYTQILRLFNYHSIGQVPLIDDYINEYSKAAGLDLRPLMVDTCDAWFNQSDMSCCAPIDVKAALEKANSASLNEIASNIPDLNTLPKTFRQLMVDVQNLRNNSEKEQNEFEPCLNPCDIIEHDYRLTTKSAPNLSDNPGFDFTIEYITMEVVTFVEIPRKSLSEYIALIGGNIGMWNGATIVSLTHLFALLLRALGFHPFDSLIT